MTLELISERIYRAQEAGWVFEDSQFTPGCPLFMAVPPGGDRKKAKPVFKLGRTIYPIEEQMKDLDDAGVPA